MYITKHLIRKEELEMKKIMKHQEVQINKEERLPQV
jgi:hypothetical protein